MQNVELIIKFLSYLGLDFEESKVYLNLLDKGSSTILEVSRGTKISRTNVYRIVDKLKETGFVEEFSEGKKKYIHPVGMHKLEMLVKEQESKADYLRNIFPEISSIIPASNSMSQPGSKILFYKGVDGMKQMLWNTLNATGEVSGYTSHDLKNVVGAEYEQSWRKEFKYRRLHSKELIGNAEIANHLKMRILNDPDRFEMRFISGDILSIKNHTYIYNDVFAYFTSAEGEFFGIEIYNKDTSKLQKQLFEAVWRLGVEIS